MEAPLTELRNQRLPRRKMAQTYGKKKTTGMSTAHRDLFGSDESQIEGRLAGLKIETPKSSTTRPRTAIKKSARFPVQVDSVPRTPIHEKQTVISQEDAATIKPLLSLAEGDVDLFSNLGAKLAKSFNVEKIGEGSFAEVFKLTSKTELDAQSLTSHRSLPPGGAIIKLIPLHTPSSAEHSIDRVSNADAVAREIKILRTLDSVHGFTRFRGMRLVTGNWHQSFLDAFRAFKRAHRGRADNASPEKAFAEKQIYAMVEMDNAGSEIFLIKRPSVFQVHDILWSTAILLANAEEQVEFEHRDLHLSNVCVKPLITPNEEGEGSTADAGSSTATLPHLDIDHSLLASMTDSDIPEVKLGLSNLKITIIDYTVTRCQLEPAQQASSNTITTTKDKEILYDTMRFVSELERGDNDPKWENNVQLATYRKTGAAVEYAQRMSNTPGNKWRQFVPRTNVIWLAYLLKTLGRRAHGRNKKYYIVKGSSKAAKTLQENMWDVLALVEDVLCGEDPEVDEDNGGAAVEEEDEDDDDDDRPEFSDEEIERTPASARELLARAVEEGWLRREEIEVMKARLESEC